MLHYLKPASQFISTIQSFTAIFIRLCGATWVSCGPLLLILFSSLSYFLIQLLCHKIALYIYLSVVLSFSSFIVRLPTSPSLNLSISSNVCSLNPSIYYLFCSPNFCSFIFQCLKFFTYLFSFPIARTFLCLNGAPFHSATAKSSFFIFVVTSYCSSILPTLYPTVDPSILRSIPTSFDPSAALSLSLSIQLLLRILIVSFSAIRSSNAPAIILSGLPLLHLSVLSPFKK